MFSLLKKAEPKTATPVTEPTRETGPRRVVSPRTDIREETDAVVLLIDVPGCDQHGVEITAAEGVLTVRATPQRIAPTGFQPLWSERDERVYERSFTLPDALDASAASAQVKHGVLTLRLPKASEARPRRIAVSAA